MERRYIKGGSDGWLSVKSESGTIIALPEYLQVEFIKEDETREYFKVIEGVHKDKLFSVLKGNLGKHPLLRYTGPASLIFNRTKKTLEFRGKTIAAHTVSGSSAIKLGNHPIQIPDFPHALGQGYMTETSRAKTWFFLGVGNAIVGGNENYLHTGRISAGCVTVDPKGWTDLYNHIALCRSSDGRTVGKISVID